MELFEEWGICSHNIIIHLCSHRWLKKLDLHIWKQQCHICLFIDNFSAHSAVSYQPTNVQVEFFKPNMTPFVQPCDAGIIWCFKAIYQHNFCSHALDLDDAGKHEIYKIDLLEAMMWQRRPGIQSPLKQSNIVGITRKSNRESLIMIPHYVEPFIDFVIVMSATHQMPCRSFYIYLMLTHSPGISFKISLPLTCHYLMQNLDCKHI